MLPNAWLVFVLGSLLLCAEIRHEIFISPRCFGEKLGLKMPQKGPKPLSNIINFNVAQFIIIEYHCDCFPFGPLRLRRSSGISLQVAQRERTAATAQGDDQSGEKLRRPPSTLDIIQINRRFHAKALVDLTRHRPRPRRRKFFYDRVQHLVFIVPLVPPPLSPPRKHLENDLLMAAFMSGTGLAGERVHQRLTIIRVHFRTAWLVTLH